MALRGDRFLVETMCDRDRVQTAIGDYVFEPVPDWQETAGLTTTLAEASLLTGTVHVHSVSFEMSTNRVSFSVTSSGGVGPDGQPCIGGFSREITETSSRLIRASSCYSSPDEAPNQSIDLREVDPAALANAFAVAAAEAGLPLTETSHLDLRATRLPDELVRSEPYLFAMWSPEKDSVIKIAVSLSGEVLHTERV